ncbi:hypothetical protein Dimus_028243 [Dionaea muscipula]
MASLMLLLLLGFASSDFSFTFAETRKELRSKKEDHVTVTHTGHSTQFKRVNPSKVVQISWRPRVFIYEGLISDQDCDHLISLANRRNEDVDSLEGRNGSLDSILELPFDTTDVVVSSIEEKISAWTLLPKENSRPLQILHYGREQADQKYGYFGNKLSENNLMASVILYLSNATRGGGEILFPDSEVRRISFGSLESSNLLRPVKGNAVLFFHVHPNASRDKSSSHERRPVLEGDMWCATKAFNLRSVKSESDDSSECTDEDHSCPQWAALGECQKNPVFMVGSPDYYGTCRKSCKVC